MSPREIVTFLRFYHQRLLSSTLQQIITLVTTNYGDACVIPYTLGLKLAEVASPIYIHHRQQVCYS